MHCGDQIEEAVGRVGGQQEAIFGQLPPGHQLAGKEGEGGQSGRCKTEPDHVYLASARGDHGTLQRDAAQHQHAGVQPEQPWQRQRSPIRQAHAHEIGAGEQ